MKITLSDKIIAYLALLSGLTISAVAVWYSVAGLVSIFAAAVTPIIVMGVALEVSKLIATVWLKLNWQRAPVFIKTYMTAAVVVLMIITSMGIFGFLSKAHSDQSLVSGDVQSRIAVYDDKIRTAKDNIDANRKALKQMDEAVDQVMARSSSETGADKAVGIRRSQQKERARLQSEIAAEQKIIAAVSEERAPIAAEVRKVEAEVGPIKYIAAFVYGDNPDANVLEKAVTWVIIIIVSVFDPLAVILLLASQYSFQWFRKAREEEEADEKEVKDWFDQGKERARQLDIEAANAAKYAPIVEEPDLVAEANAKLAEIEPDEEEERVVWEGIDHTRLSSDSDLPEEKEPVPAEVPVIDEEDHVDFDINDSEEMKAAKARWKAEHPDGSLKNQRRLLELGAIDHLPWEDYLEAKPEPVVDEAALEAAKWAAEQLAMHEVERPGDYVKDSEVKKKSDDVDGKAGQPASEEKQGSVGYVQNSEQSASTLWTRVKDAKGE